MSDTIRLRFAPSPTGKLHIGGARTALFNWAYARRTGGVFVLRVEDTDRERSLPEHEEAILEGLRWLGLDWDEGPDVGGEFGPYRQSERADGHRRAAQELFEKGWAYRCFCSQERLVGLREERRKLGQSSGYDGRCREIPADEAERRVAAGESAVLRFRVPAGETRFHDMTSGWITFQNAEVEDWIMVRASGDPTYNFVVVCDDRDMRITHVVRGEDHLTNTPKQVLLYNAFGVEPPAFAHVPLMLGSDKKKLSKRTGDTALQDYRDKGYPPEAVCNFLALQSWALDAETTVFSRDQLVQNFDPADIRKGGSVFDPQKFLWMAGEYLRTEPLERLADRSIPYLVKEGLATEGELADRRAWLSEALELERERVRLYSEVPSQLAYLFAADDAVAYDEKALKNARKHEGAADTLAAFRDWLAPRIEGDFDPDALGAEAKAWIAERGLKIPALFQPLRCALSGAAGGADLFRIVRLLGPERALGRIDRMRAQLAG